VSTQKQILYIGILFLGLILLSAGVGALAAGEMLIGMSLLIGGLFFVIIDGTIMIMIRKKNLSKSSAANSVKTSDTSTNTNSETKK
jgi:hypothetical protein